MLSVSKFFIYFIIYSFMGWIMEVFFCFYKEHKFVNRGFLIGPVCPIYGWGVLLIVFLIDGNKSDIFAVFLKSIFICSTLEYATSFIMEKLFKARWWDYSERRFNINGRICLETMIPFGLLGSAVILYVHPFFVNIVSKLNDKLTIIVGISLMVIYLVDNLISFNVLNKIKNEISKHEVDNTEEIRNKVMKWLKGNSLLVKHIFMAFPRFKIIKRMKERLKK